MKTIIEHSAGGAVFHYELRATSYKPKWLVCKHSGYHKWALPKGIIEDGETAEEAATREVKEETGVKATIIKKITPDVRYKYQKKEFLVDKMVEFFLMEYQSGDTKDHNWEMEEVRWVSKEEALTLLAFEEERRILQSALQLRIFQH